MTSSPGSTSEELGIQSDVNHSHFVGRRRTRSWKAVRRPSRKIRTPKFRSFRAPKQVTKKVKDLKDLKELKLVTTLSNGIKKLGNPKTVKLSSFPYKPQMKNTRLRPRFKQSPTRGRRASSAVMLRSENETVETDERYRSSSFDIVSSQGTNNYELEEAFASLDEIIDEDDHDEDECGENVEKADLHSYSNRRLVKTQSGSGVFFANGFFALTVSKHGSKSYLGFEVEDCYCNDNSKSSCVIITNVTSLYGKDGGLLPIGSLNTGDMLELINDIPVSNREEFICILRNLEGMEVKLGVRHGTFPPSRKFALALEDNETEFELSSSDELTSPEPKLFYPESLENISCLQIDGEDTPSAQFQESGITKDFHIETTKRKILEVLQQKVEVLTLEGEASYKKVQEAVEHDIQVSLVGSIWRAFFTKQLDSICDKGEYYVLGMDMQEMSPVISRER